MAAPAFVTSYGNVYNNNTTPKTASATAANGDVLVVLGGTENGNATVSTPTGGTGITWTSRGSQPASPTNVESYCAAFSCSPSAQSWTLSVARSGSAVNWGWSGLRFSGSDGIGAASGSDNGTGSGTPSWNITTTGDNSAICVIVVDWNAADGASRTYPTVNGAAPTEVTYFRNSNAYTVYVFYYADAGTAGSKTVGVSSPGGQRWVGIAVEVLGSAGSTSKAQTGHAALGLGGIAAAAKVTAQAGSVAIGPSAQATARKLTAQAATVPIGLSTQATANKVQARFGTVVVGLAASGAAAKKQAVTGLGNLGLSGRGPTQAERVVSARLHAALGGYATVRKVVTPVARSLVGFSGTSTSKKVATPAATVLIGLNGRGTPVKRATPTSVGSVGLWARGAGVHIGKGASLARVGFSGQTTAFGKRITVLARGAVGFVGYGVVQEQRIVLGPADIIDSTGPTRLTASNVAVTLASITNPTRLDYSQ